MTIKEAILKTLEENKKMMSFKEIYDYIIKKNLYQFNAINPKSVLYSQIRSFIKKDDDRIKRIKSDDGYFLYYLSKYEDKILSKIDSNEIDLDEIVLKKVKTSSTKTKLNNKTPTKKTRYKERDLHPLFVTYLRGKNILAKTIYHEISKHNGNQKWVHPDIIGIEFLELKSKTSSKFLKTIDKKNFFSLYSFELKREIKNDYELKESYFQAVSNSSWANYGYLVALKIDETLLDELQRLNQSFGIGVILLNSYPERSKILFNAQFRELDIRTIDKLCEYNGEFEKFIELTEKYLKASDDYINGIKKEMLEFCDDVLKEKEIKEYCELKNIPFN